MTGLSRWWRRVTLMQDCLNDDQLAEGEAIDLPGITSGSPDPEPAWGFAPASGAVKRWSWRNYQWRSCRLPSQGDRARRAEPLSPDDEGALIGGHAEP